MATPPLSAGSLLVLRHLRRADGEQVLKLAVRELLARGSFEPGETDTRRGDGGGD